MCLKFWQQTFRGHAKKYHFFLLEIPPEIRLLGAKHLVIQKCRFPFFFAELCGGSASTTQPTLQRPSRSIRPKPPPPFPMSSTDILAASGWRIVTEGHHLAKTEPSDDSSAAPPRPPRRSAGARPVRPGRPAKPAKLTEAGVTNSFLHQKCLFLCVEDELRAWNVDVHCSSLVKGLDWTARETLC